MRIGGSLKLLFRLMFGFLTGSSESDSTSGLILSASSSVCCESSIGTRLNGLLFEIN